MKVLVIVCLCVATFAQNIIKPKPATRRLPADVLRDFPNMCFGSTAGRVFQVGQSWPLVPFCGFSTCVKDGANFIEVVQDCGLRPKESPGCKVINENDFNQTFPDCCPQYACEPGKQLLFPTEEELKEAQLNAATVATAAVATAAATAGSTA